MPWFFSSRMHGPSWHSLGRLHATGHFSLRLGSGSLHCNTSAAGGCEVASASTRPHVCATGPTTAGAQSRHGLHQRTLPVLGLRKRAASGSNNPPMLQPPRLPAQAAMGWAGAPQGVGRTEVGGQVGGWAHRATQSGCNLHQKQLCLFGQAAEWAGKRQAWAVQGLGPKTGMQLGRAFGWSGRDRRVLGCA